MKLERNRLGVKTLSFLLLVYLIVNLLRNPNHSPVARSIEISLIGLLFAVFCGGIKKNLFDPWNQLLMVWLLFGVLHPIARNLSLTSDSYLNGQLGLDLLGGLPIGINWFSIGMMATLTGVTVGYHVYTRRQRQDKLEVLKLHPNFEVILVLIWLIGMFLLVKHIGLGGLLQWRSRQTQSKLIDFSSYLFFTNYLLIVPATLRLLKKDRSRKDTGIGYVLLYSPVIINLLSGNRIFVIPILILHFLIWTLQLKSVNVVKLIAIILILFTASTGIRLIREYLDPYSNFSSRSFKSQLISVFQGQDFAMVDNFSLLIASDKHNSDFPLVDYFNLVTKPIPRHFWPSKPLTFDQKLNSVILPRSSQVGYGFSFTFFGEGFFELGLIGIPFMGFLFGFFLGICRGLIECTGINRRKILGLIGISTLVVFVRGSFSADSPRLLFTLIPLILARPVKRS